MNDPVAVSRAWGLFVLLTALDRSKPPLPPAPARLEDGGPIKVPVFEPSPVILTGRAPTRKVFWRPRGVSSASNP